VFDFRLSGVFTLRRVEVPTTVVLRGGSSGAIAPLQFQSFLLCVPTVRDHDSLPALSGVSRGR